MLFSEKYKIKKNGAEDWFDPILDTDIKLFIDPYLISHSEDSDFISAHKSMVDFFQKAFEMVTLANKTNKPEIKRRALSMLSFPEVPELCLGYSSQSTKGSGTGITFSHLFYEAITEYINMGLKTEDINQLEIINIFVDGIGRDRISDITANLLKPQLVKYTQEICRKHRIPLKKLPIENIKLDQTSFSWQGGYEELPQNPVSGRAVLLVPKHFLRRLPTLNECAFIEFLSAGEAATLRRTLHIDITKDIDKDKIKKIIKSKPTYLKDFINDIIENHKPAPYDLSIDEDLVYRWYEFGKVLSKKFPAHGEVIGNDEDFKKFLIKMCGYFKNCIENQEGYKLLWNDYGEPRKEEAVQNLFNMTIRSWCEANDIDLTRESSEGRGAVDFKFSQGYKKRGLVEIKLAKNKKLLKGINKQLPMYLQAAEIKLGIFLVVFFEKKEFVHGDEIKEAIKVVIKNQDVDISYISIDATGEKPSASTL